MQKKEIAILDFGSEKITVVVGSKDVNNTFVIRGKGESDYAGFLDGEFLEPDKLKNAMDVAISNAEEDAGVAINKLYIGVPAEFCYCVCKKVSQSYDKYKVITAKDVDELFAQGNNFSDINTHTVINRTPICYVIDEDNHVLTPVGKSAQKLRASLSFVMAENSFIQLVNSCLYELDIASCEYLSSTLAQSLFLFDEETREGYAILVDCGYITTSVCLIRGEGMLSLSSFSQGGGHITADLSTCLKIPFSDAEILKRKIVLNIDPQENDTYGMVINSQPVPISSKTANAIVESRVEVIAKGILKCMGLWEYSYPDYIPIYLTGGGLSYLKGAKDLLAKIIGRNVEILSSPTTQYNKPHLTSAISLLNLAIVQEELKQPKGFWKKVKKIFS